MNVAREEEGLRIRERVERMLTFISLCPLYGGEVKN